MKTLYIECSMGAAGDMLMAGLFDAMDEEQRASFLEQMNSLGLEGLSISMEKSLSYGISGSHAHVVIDGVEEGDMLAEMFDGLDGQPEHKHEHHEHEGGHAHGHAHEHAHGHHHEHHSPQSVAETIASLSVPASVRSAAQEVYSVIARAEGTVHGESPELVHYHEVGAKDAIADVVGVCLAMEMLAPEEVVVSPIHVGSGTIRCAHGVVPVPVPAAVEILKGAPTYGGEIQGELCTPTGAALLVHFADSFNQMPPMKVERVGYGIGVRDFGRANCLRAFLGERTSEAGTTSVNAADTIAELVCNIDDMSPEKLAYACSRLLEHGALDAYTTPGTMKKGRPGHVLTVLCMPSDVEQVAQAVLRETTSNGLRIHLPQKRSLEPRVENVVTEWGSVRIKIAEGYGIRHVKPEYEDVARIASENNLPYEDVFNAALQAFEG